ncbi:hypothetical protein [Streptosporangium longisporum]|uniref:Glycosyltransferase RgtA/B/C/D-like domain-containing protein n=1 Tax=Streptosporangium longisporum TaxID=46187 RepID=A0ABN3Y3U7_9ACTN
MTTPKAAEAAETGRTGLTPPAPSDGTPAATGGEPGGTAPPEGHDGVPGAPEAPDVVPDRVRSGDDTGSGDDVPDGRGPRDRDADEDPAGESAGEPGAEDDVETGTETDAETGAETDAGTGSDTGTETGDGRDEDRPGTPDDEITGEPPGRTFAAPVADAPEDDHRDTAHDDAHDDARNEARDRIRNEARDGVQDENRDEPQGESRDEAQDDLGDEVHDENRGDAARDDLQDEPEDEPDYDPDVTAVIRLPLRPLPPPRTDDAPGAGVPGADAPGHVADDATDGDADEDAEDTSDNTAEIRLPSAPLRPDPAGRLAPRAPDAKPGSMDEDNDPPGEDTGFPDEDDDPSDEDTGPAEARSEPRTTEPPKRQAPEDPGRPAPLAWPWESEEEPETSGLPETVPAVRPPAVAYAPAGHATDRSAAAPAGAGGPAPAAAPSRMASLVRTAMVWLPPLLTVEGLIMYVLALRVPPGPLWGVDLNKIDGVGLISAMPPTAFAAILLMLVAFFVTIAQNTDRKFLLLFQIAAITFALHGGAALIEDEARFHTAYVHAGFVEYINRTGEASAILDARLAWPGFFALVGFVTKAAGVTDLTTIMRWTPLLSNLLYLLPFVLILRQVVATTRARWFAALLFVIVQWIGQDYFSSQGFTYAIYLAFVAIVLRWFGKVEPRTRPMPVKGPVRRLLARLDGLTPGELPHSTGVYDRTIMLIVLIGLFATATASHQITPFMMLGALTGLILLRRSSLSWGLPFFLGLMVLAWISYQTVTFWSGHIDQLFGGLGRILENLQSNTGDRIDGSDPKHALVLMARLGICGVILTLAAAGLFRRLRRGVGDRAALLLLCIPVLALGLQNYGGEIGLRIYLFALPGACILAAYAFFPNLPAGTEDAPEETVPIRKRNIRFNPELTRRISLLLAAGCAMALAMVFLVARYGNEQFERVSASEVAAMHYVYEHDEPSARVLYLVPLLGEEVTPSIPWGERDFDRIAYEQVLVDKNPAQLTSVIAKLRTSPPNTYLVATRGQAGYLQLNHGFPTDWAPRFRAALDANKELKRVFNGEDAAVYTLRSFPKGTTIPERAAPVGGNDPTSPLTPVGLAALGVTWIALFAYEVFLLRGRGRANRTRRRILFVAIPAFVLAVGVIAERFVVIGYQLQ